MNIFFFNFLFGWILICFCFERFYLIQSTYRNQMVENFEFALKKCLSYVEIDVKPVFDNNSKKKCWHFGRWSILVCYVYIGGPDI